MFDELLEKLQLTLKAHFIPWKVSKRCQEKDPSLNWEVDLFVKGKKAFTTDYSMGCGHCRCYKQGDNTFYQRSLLIAECNSSTGKKFTDTKGFFYSIISDAEAIDYPDYEEWANTFGYNTDSRSGEKIYRACIDIGLKLRAAIGDDAINQLREALKDY